MVDELVRAGASAKAARIALAAAVGGFLFGFDTAVVNGAVDALRETFHLDAFMTGMAVSIALIGSALGAWQAGRLADRHGRLAVMRVGAALFFVSALGSGLCFGAWDLMFWRLVGGVGIGFASVIAPAYIAEIAPAHTRGRLGSLQQLAIVVGIFVSLLSDALLARLAGGTMEPLAWGLAAWRWMFLVGIVPAIVYALLSFAIPESPRFLVSQGELQKAEEVLSRVLPTGRPSDKVEEIRRSLGRQSEGKPTFRDLRGGKLGLLPIVWTGIGLSMFQQLVGINVIFYYSTSLWRSVGFREESAFGITVATSVTNVLVTLVAIALVDRIGRKPLLLAGSVGMALSLAVMALCFSQAVQVGGEPSLPAPWGPVAWMAANLYVVCFGCTWGPVVWVLLGEMFPNRLRAGALAVAAAAQWITNFAVTTSFPVMAAEWSLTFAYAFYALSAAGSYFFVRSRLQETKGIELEQMATAPVH